MVGEAGVLRWGKSSKRNVISRDTELGPSSAFERNRRRKADAYQARVFRVITTKNKEFHFVCESGVEVAELWVRGINLVTRKAIFGKKHSETYQEHWHFDWIPMSLGAFVKLDKTRSHLNQLTIKFRVIWRISNPTQLNLRSNQLNGTIPESLGQLSEPDGLGFI
ncbi:hypothetical protein IFM89_016214 [Coptis chinensis]|uniref:PH domain-containing protein n=1 Tax=Coptis chinensis TaxID=261450 RepID=A0A835H463_9MAGN|nr:hypothetical protein IFM89_016214 [Coptis chinensis]